MNLDNPENRIEITVQTIMDNFYFYFFERYSLS
jgi:hypothetical protein